jgi:DNA-binding MarR family transcriptional regulator
MIESPAASPGAAGDFILEEGSVADRADYFSTSLSFSLRRACQAVDAVFTENLSALDITPAQVTVLQAVEAFPQCSQIKLVEVTGIDRSTIADIVKRLMKRDLLTRRRTKQDARSYAVKLTPEGERVVREASKAAEKTDMAIAGILMARASFDGHLQQIIATLKERRKC